MVVTLAAETQPDADEPLPSGDPVFDYLDRWYYTPRRVRILLGLLPYYQAGGPFRKSLSEDEREVLYQIKRGKPHLNPWAAQAETFGEIQAALDALPPYTRNIVEKVYGGGWDCQRLADRLGRHRNTVGNHASWGVETIAASLGYVGRRRMMGRRGKPSLH